MLNDEVCWRLFLQMYRFLQSVVRSDIDLSDFTPVKCLSSEPKFELAGPMIMRYWPPSKIEKAEVT